MTYPLSFEAAVSLLDSAQPAETDEDTPPHGVSEPAAAPAAASGKAHAIDAHPAPESAPDLAPDSGDEAAYDDLASVDVAEEGQGEGDSDGEGDAEGDSGDPPAIAAPRSWDAEGRALFATLPRAAQERITARENERDRAVSRAQQEAHDARRRAETEASNLGRYQAELDQLLPRADRVFADRWQGVDWVAWAKADPAAAQVGRLQFEAEQTELARLNAVHQLGQAHARERYRAEEGGKLARLAPDLADPERGPSRRAEVARFLVDNGAEPAVLQDLGAAAIAIAYDAMRYRAAETALKTRPPHAPRPAARAPVRPPVRPSASQPATAQARTAQAAAGRFAQTGSIDDAIALLNARGR